jgi:hypothetical protein
MKNVLLVQWFHTESVINQNELYRTVSTNSNSNSNNIVSILEIPTYTQTLSLDFLGT